MKKIAKDDPRIRYFYVTGKNGKRIRVSNVIKRSDGTEFIMDLTNKGQDNG